MLSFYPKKEVMDEFTFMINTYEFNIIGPTNLHNKYLCTHLNLKLLYAFICTSNVEHTMYNACIYVLCKLLCVSYYMCIHIVTRYCKNTFKDP